MAMYTHIVPVFYSR